MILEALSSYEIASIQGETVPMIALRIKKLFNE